MKHDAQRVSSDALRRKRRGRPLVRDCIVDIGLKPHFSRGNAVPYWNDMKGRHQRRYHGAMDAPIPAVMATASTYQTLQNGTAISGEYRE